jgi:hypothetical protein
LDFISDFDRFVYPNQRITASFSRIKLGNCFNKYRFSFAPAFAGFIVFFDKKWQLDIYYDKSAGMGRYFISVKYCFLSFVSEFFIFLYRQLNRCAFDMGDMAGNRRRKK